MTYVNTLNRLLYSAKQDSHLKLICFYAIFKCLYIITPTSPKEICPIIL